MFKDFIILIGVFFDNAYYNTYILPTAVNEIKRIGF